MLWTRENRWKSERWNEWRSREKEQRMDVIDVKQLVFIRPMHAGCCVCVFACVWVSTLIDFGLYLRTVSPPYLACVTHSKKQLFFPLSCCFSCVIKSITARRKSGSLPPPLQSKRNQNFFLLPFVYDFLSHVMPLHQNPQKLFPLKWLLLVFRWPHTRVGEEAELTFNVTVSLSRFSTVHVTCHLSAQTGTNALRADVFFFHYNL